ncbi:MAG: DUF3450 family protein [Planctomycetes bacterium]|nr:DUF3450 family protein [Planctomycetota bacterium]
MQSFQTSPTVRGTLFAALTIGALAAPASAQSERQQGDPARDRVAVTRTTLQEWVENNRIYSKEKQQWREEREYLRDRIELVQRETESLKTRIGEAEQSIGEADKKRGDLAEQNERLTANSMVLAEQVVTLEEKTRRLLARLPDPLRERIAPVSQRIPADSAETKLSLSERFQNVIGVLNEVNKFQRDVHLAREVRNLEAGKTAEVSVLYFGIAFAYYVTDDGKEAGVGVPGDKGFAWTPSSGFAPAIARAVAIKKGEQVAAFVSLPVKLL